MPPKAAAGAWEHGVIAIETIEGDENDTKWAYLMWADVDKAGKHRQSRVLLQTCYTTCPQMVSTAHFPSPKKIN